MNLSVNASEKWNSFSLTFSLPFTNFSTMLSTATFEGAQARTCHKTTSNHYSNEYYLIIASLDNYYAVASNL